jgi:hypothetical protein
LQANQLTDIITKQPVLCLVALPASQALTTTFLRRRSMKFVKNFLYSVVLVIAVALNTPAGQQDTPGFVPPPPPPATSTSDEYTSVDNSNTEPVGGVTVETSDYLLFEALMALLSVY